MVVSAGGPVEYFDHCCIAEEDWTNTVANVSCIPWAWCTESGYTIISDEYLCVFRSITISFFINKCHHKMSAWAALLSLKWCIGWEPSSWSAYSILRNGLPGHKTLNANCSRPVMGGRTFFEITLFDTTCQSSLLKFTSLSSGKQILYSYGTYLDPLKG